MNFYQAQDDAYRRTRLLVIYFILAVLGVIFAIYAVLAGYMMLSSKSADAAAGVGQLENARGFWDSALFVKVSLATVAVILAGNLFKSLQLSGGGAVVARDMGGRQIDPSTTDTDEKRLMNVVEEMAIASGVPVPQVWLMDDEPGINAFAAGTEPGNAVIGVTRGCVQRLSRSELQGVVAHEFSHILNGDMKLNMRLIGWLFGIMMLTLIGRELLFSMRFMHFRSNRENNNGGAAIAMLVAGLALMIIGAIGVFFARMIQAAISRQREYLADASAVQFTREPEGIANALRKIGGQQYGSSLASAKAGEASHMFFADGGMFSYGFATHPPLDVRIKAIEPHWDGSFSESEIPAVGSRRAHSDQRVSGFSSGVSPDVHVERAQWDKLGESSQTNVAVGKAILASLERDWVEACHDREGAQSLIFGLLLASDGKLRDKEEGYLRKSLGDVSADLAVNWQKTLQAEHSSKKMAMIDLAIPTLRRLSMPEYERFISVTQWMIASDGQVDIFEFMLQKVLQRHLSAHFHPERRTQVKFHQLTQLSEEINVLLSTMSGIGANDEASVHSAYEDAVAELRRKGMESLSILPPQQCGLQRVDTALAKIVFAAAGVRGDILHACGLAVMADGILGSREAELLRAAADAMGCSLPPFVNVQ